MRGKRIGYTVAAAFAVAAVLLVAVYAQAAKTKIRWTYDSKTDPPCNAVTGQRNCIAEFPVTVDIASVSVERFVLPHTALQCPTPLPAKPANCVDISGIFYGEVQIASLGALPYGTVVVGVKARGFDNAGVGITSVNNSVGFLNLPRPVVNLTAE